ncbi:hypothetical protein [Nioella sp.]|uniref:hypothetical protein n=1 Tax=Nioella sp. TaxID=1912091 RepID=UPI003A836799
MTASYLIRRLLAVILVLIIVTFAVFALTMILPGNAAIMILGEYRTETSLAALEARLGLDQPWYVQYYDWVSGVVQGDFGQSLRLSLPVSEVVGEVLPQFSVAGCHGAGLGDGHCHPSRPACGSAARVEG